MDKPVINLDELNQLRRQARARSIVLPGAGLALIGYRRRGWLALAPSLVGVLAIYALVLEPCAIGFWTLVVCTALALVSGVYEYIAVGRLPVWQLPTPSQQSRSRLACWVSAMVAVVTLWAAAANVRFFVMDTEDMTPGIVRGDVLMSSKYSPVSGMAAGRVIVFDAYRQHELARVRAMPGDKLSTDGGELLVNGVKTGPAGRIDTPDLSIPFQPATVTVPEDHYLLTRDADDSGVWIQSRHIVTSRLMMLVGKRGLGVGLAK